MLYVNHDEIDANLFYVGLSPAAPSPNCLFERLNSYNISPTDSQPDREVNWRPLFRDIRPLCKLKNPTSIIYTVGSLCETRMSERAYDSI